MKKEIIAACVLVFLLAAVLMNSLYLSNLTDNLLSLVRKAESAALKDDWFSASSTAQDAIELWNSHTDYAHVVLNHDDVGLMCDSFYELLEEIHAGNIGTVSSTAEMVITRLEDISQTESASPGSIF